MIPWKREGKNLSPKRLMPIAMTPMLEEAWLAVVRRQGVGRDNNNALFIGAVYACADLHDAIVRSNIYTDAIDGKIAKYFYLDQKGFILGRLKLASSISKKEMPNNHTAWRRGYLSFMSSILSQLNKGKANDSVL